MTRREIIREALTAVAFLVSALGGTILILGWQK